MSSDPGPRTSRTPFSIADILSPRAASGGSPVLQLREWSAGPASPLCALEELTSQTLRGLDRRRPRPPEGRALGGAAPGPGPAARRKRKSRTAFTAQQVLELERLFGFQKYLAPAERDGLAARLGLANAQVVTWFQNRRAKLRRDVEELRADLASLRAPEELSGSSPRPTEPAGEPALQASDDEIQVDD